MIARVVPQGTVLGPVQFLAIIVEINQDITYSSLSSIADDTRLFMIQMVNWQDSRLSNTSWQYKSVKCPTDCDYLQKGLNVVYEWVTENNMRFNISHKHS